MYTNILAGLLLLLAIPLAREEQAVATRVRWTPGSVAVVFISCAIGLGVSHSAYVMRLACSATLSAVVGIICKALTVIFNMLIWDKHASPVEWTFLAVGLLAGGLYEQAPLRLVNDTKRAKEFVMTDTNESDPSCANVART